MGKRRSVPQWQPGLWNRQFLPRTARPRAKKGRPSWQRRPAGVPGDAASGLGPALPLTRWGHYLRGDPPPRPGSAGGARAPRSRSQPAGAPGALGARSAVGAHGAAGTPARSRSTAAARSAHPRRPPAASSPEPSQAPPRDLLARAYPKMQGAGGCVEGEEVRAGPEEGSEPGARPSSLEEAGGPRVNPFVPGGPGDEAPPCSPHLPAEAQRESRPDCWGLGSAPPRSTPPACLVCPKVTLSREKKKQGPR